jgi:3-dehydroquinate synthase
MMEITVNLGDRSYPIILVHDASNAFPAVLKKRFPKSRFAIVTNTTLAIAYKEVLAAWERDLSLVKFVLPDGEQYKSVEIWNSVVDFLIKYGLDRKSVVCALGGGVVGDIAGFAASTFLRGVSLVQIPTTLLAMVDSSVGGKTGVNHSFGKNLIGAFHQPSMVWLDTGFLSTLPEREFTAGYAELFKYAFIGGQEMFDFVLDQHEHMYQEKDMAALVEGIRRSLEIKARIVEADEREERGTRAFLNFGHTFAHAIERFYNFDKVLHGEAVLFGLRCACDLGIRVGSVPAAFSSKYEEIIGKCPAIALPEVSGSRPEAETLYRAMFTDKKMVGGQLTFVIPTTPGSSILSLDVPKHAVLESLGTILKGL